MKRPMLSIREARARLSCGETTMRLLIGSGQVPAAKIRGIWRIDSDDLERFIEAEKAKARRSAAAAPAAITAPIDPAELTFA